MIKYEYELLPIEILDALAEDGLSSKEIVEELEEGELFSAYLASQGLYGYTDCILSIIRQLDKAKRG